MNTDLIEYLKGVVSPETVSIFEQTYETLFNLKGDDVNVAIMDMVKTLSQNDAEINVSYIYDVTMEYVIITLKEFGVHVDNEIGNENLETLSLILKGLIEIEYCEDPEYLLSTIEEEGDNEIRGFAEVISYITLVNVETIVEVVEKLSDGLVERMVNVLRERISEEDQEDDGLIVEINPLLKPYILKYKDRIDEDILRNYIKKPNTLSLLNILRLHGNKMADDKSGECTWLFVLLVSSDGKEPQNLFDIWGKHFLEEKDLVIMGNKVNTLYNLVVKEFSND